MTRLFLAAGVAALAISAPATARPGDHGNKDRQTAERQKGGQRAQTDDRRASRQSARQERRAAPQRMERAQRSARVERQQVRQRPARVERQQARAEQRERVQVNRVRENRQAARQDRVRQNRIERVRTDRVANRQEIRGNRQLNRIDNRRELRAERQIAQQNRQMNRDILRADRQIRQQNRVVERQALREARLPTFVNRTRFIEPARAASVIGVPLSTATTMLALSPVPASVSYLYPDTSDYYYRYGDGYLYQVDRGSNLIAALLPLLAGGFMPGQYVPNYYMNSYVPSYWGLNSFYPTSYANYGGYGYGYDNLCNRYYNGVVYQVDCVTGMVRDVVPLYASGYGVGQYLPTSYAYYNVPYQYRSMYYNTPDYNYWYAPGAIYQYDPSSSLITSVAALMSPGFTIGQPLPLGYSTYNVPYAYRSTYYDTPNAWYRYNNGYIYQVDPTTQLVSAIVASILT